jgi:hypothetical protein
VAPRVGYCRRSGPWLSWGSGPLQGFSPSEPGCGTRRPPPMGFALRRLRGGLAVASLTSQPALRSLTRLGGGGTALAASRPS